MALRLFRRIKLLGGVNLNISKGGLGLSAGIKGARIGINKRGVYRSVGIPNTGAYDMAYLGKNKNLPVNGVEIPAKKGFSLIKIPLYIILIVFWPITLAYFIVKMLMRKQSIS